MGTAFFYSYAITFMFGDPFRHPFHITNIGNMILEYKCFIFNIGTDRKQPVKQLGELPYYPKYGTLG